MLLPFAREELASLISKGGFPQLLIQPINFESIYRQRLANAKQEGRVATQPLVTLADPSISVLGAGSWGTALAILLGQNLREVRLWGRNSAEALAKDRSNQRYLPDIKFPLSLVIDENLTDAINSELNFLVVVPSHAFRATLESLAEGIQQKSLSARDATILWGTKGFDTDAGALLSEVVTDVFPDIGTYGVIIWPEFRD